MAKIEIDGEGYDIEFDASFDKLPQFEAMVQLRIHQDNVVYSRINALLFINSMLILAFVQGGVLEKPIIAIVVALIGLFSNLMVWLTLMRQNKVLQINIDCVNALWTTGHVMEGFWNYMGPIKHWYDFLKHARIVLTVIVPIGFLLFWCIALVYAWNICSPCSIT